MVRKLPLAVAAAVALAVPAYAAPKAKFADNVLGS